MIARAKRRLGNVQDWPKLIATYTVVVLTLTAGAIALNAKSESATLKNNLIDACATSRTPLSVYFAGEIEATRRTDPRFFPDIPPEVFRMLLQQKIDRLEDVAEVIDPKKCEDQYK